MERTRQAFITVFQEILSCKLSFKHFGLSPDFWGLSEEHLNFQPAPEQCPTNVYIFPVVNNVCFCKAYWSRLRSHLTTLMCLLSIQEKAARSLTCRYSPYRYVLSVNEVSQYWCDSRLCLCHLDIPQPLCKSFRPASRTSADTQQTWWCWVDGWNWWS